MQELIKIENVDGELRVDSRVIAEKLGNEHKNVLEMIRKHSGKLEKYGRITFQTRPQKTAGGIQSVSVCFLNERQSAFLATVSKKGKMKNAPANEKMMTILEVSKVFNVTSKTITRYVAKLFPEKLHHGSTTFLNESQVTAIKLDLEKNKHLDTSVTLPKTDLEKELIIQQAIQFQTEKITRLETENLNQKKQLKIAQPKIEFHDQVETSENSISVAQFANMLTKKGFDIGQNRLFDFFYEHKYLINRSRPYQKSLEGGWFEVKKQTYLDYEEKQQTSHKMKVTGKGQVYFTKQLKKHYKQNPVQTSF